jgi:hypothetical protein
MMFDQRLRRALLAGTAAGVLFAGPAVAQEQCTQRLDQIEQQLGQAKLDPQRQSDINHVVEGARLLADTGDEEGCMNVVAELDDLMTTLQEADRLETAQGGQQAEQAQAGGQAEQAGETSGPLMTQTGDQSQTGQQGQAQTQAGAEPAPGDTSAGQMTQTGDQPQAGDQQAGNRAQAQEEVTARVTIDQPQPQVVVKQKPPKITVRIPKPIITVRLPKPEVQIEMPDPEVQVEQFDPDIQVVMGQPDLQLQGTEAQGGQGQQQVSADVQFERDQQQQPEVEILTEEPEVRVEQEDANVEIAASDEPQGQQLTEGQQQALAAPSNEQPTPTAKEQLDESAGADEPEGQPQPTQARQEAQPERDMAATDQEEQVQVTEENPLAAIPASDVIGAEVKNQDGDTVAEVVDLVKRQGQEDLYAVLSVGGFLGIGDKEVMVPVNELQVSQDGEIVMVNASEDQLKEMPEYQEEGFESTAQLEQPPAQR